MMTRTFVSLAIIPAISGDLGAPLYLLPFPAASSLPPLPRSLLVLFVPALQVFIPRRFESSSLA